MDLHEAARDGRLEDIRKHVAAGARRAAPPRSAPHRPPRLPPLRSTLSARRRQRPRCCVPGAHKQGWA